MSCGIYWAYETLLNFLHFQLITPGSSSMENVYYVYIYPYPRGHVCACKYVASKCIRPLLLSHMNCTCSGYHGLSFDFWHFVWLTCKQWTSSLWNMFSVGQCICLLFQVYSTDLKDPWGTQNGLSGVIKVRLCSSLSKWIYFSVWVSSVSWGLH